MFSCEFYDICWNTFFQNTGQLLLEHLSFITAASGTTILLLPIFLLIGFPRASFNQAHTNHRVYVMLYRSFHKQIISNLLLIALTLMAFLVQYIQIKTKTQKLKLWKWNRNCLAVFVHFIISFLNYIEMEDVLKFWSMSVFLFLNKILFSNWKFTMAVLGHQPYSSCWLLPKNIKLCNLDQ